MRDPARPLGLGALLTLGINGTVGVGIFFAPATVARHAPPGSSPWAFAVTALALAPAALCFARLGRRFPRDGGPAVYARAAFGQRAGFFVGWVAYVGALFSTASMMIGLGRSLAAPFGFGSGALRVGAALFALGLAALAAAGLRPSARVWSALTLLKLAPLALLVGAAAAAGFVAPGGAPALPAAAPEPDWGRALLAAVFPLQGFEIVPVTAGRARPGRTVPAAVLLTLAASSLLYVALQAACGAALGGALPSSASPVVEAAGAFGGATLGRLVAAGVNVSALGVAFGYIVMTPRYLAALAAEGGLDGAWADEDARAVPRRAHWATALLVALLALSFGPAFDELLTMASVTVLAQYGATALALGVLAWGRRGGVERRDGWWAAPALGLAAVLAWGASWRDWATGALALAVGAALRAWSRRGAPSAAP